MPLAVDMRVPVLSPSLNPYARREAAACAPILKDTSVIQAELRPRRVFAEQRNPIMIRLRPVNNSVIRGLTKRIIG